MFQLLNPQTKKDYIHFYAHHNKNNPTILIIHRPISLPTNTYINQIRNTNHTNSSQNKNLSHISKRTNNATTSHASIYSIPYKDCNKHYIGETQCNLEKRIYEHKLSIKPYDDRNASHMSDLKHTFNFSKATLIKTIHCKNPTDY